MIFSSMFLSLHKSHLFKQQLRILFMKMLLNMLRNIILMIKNPMLEKERIGKRLILVRNMMGKNLKLQR